MCGKIKTVEHLYECKVLTQRAQVDLIKTNLRVINNFQEVIKVYSYV